MASRHPSLVILSREHHDALLLAVRLQQGARALLRLWSHDRVVQARLTVEFSKAHLARHFRAEEEILFPLIHREMIALRPLVDGLLVDHRWFETATAKMESETSGGLESLLPEFGKRLEDHIRREDRQLFPECERLASAELLEQLRRDMEAFYAHDPPKTK